MKTETETLQHDSAELGPGRAANGGLERRLSRWRVADGVISLIVRLADSQLADSRVSGDTRPAATEDQRRRGRRRGGDTGTSRRYHGSRGYHGSRRGDTGSDPVPWLLKTRITSSDSELLRAFLLPLKHIVRPSVARVVLNCSSLIRNPTAKKASEPRKQTLR